jgi:hypothetical protein
MERERWRGIEMEKNREIEGWRKREEKDREKAREREIGQGWCSNQHGHVPLGL